MAKQIEFIEITNENIENPEHLGKFRKHAELEEVVFYLSDPGSSRRVSRYVHSADIAALQHYYVRTLLDGSIARFAPGSRTGYLVWVSQNDHYLASCILIKGIPPPDNPFIMMLTRPSRIVEFCSIQTNPNIGESGAIAFLIFKTFLMTEVRDRPNTIFRLMLAKQNYPFIDFYSRLLMYAKYGFEQLLSPSGNSIDIYGDYKTDHPIVPLQTGILSGSGIVAVNSISFQSQLKGLPELQITLPKVTYRPIDPTYIMLPSFEIPAGTHSEQEFRRLIRSVQYKFDDLMFHTDKLDKYNYNDGPNSIMAKCQEVEQIVPNSVPRIIPDHQFAFVSHSGLDVDSKPDGRIYINSFVVPDDTEIVVINTPGYATSSDILKGSWDATIRYFSKFSIEQIQQIFTGIKSDENGINITTDLDYALHTSTGLSITMWVQRVLEVQIHSYAPGQRCPLYKLGVYSFRDIPQANSGGPAPGYFLYDHVFPMYGLYEIDPRNTVYREQKWRDRENPHINNRAPTPIPGDPPIYTITPQPPHVFGTRDQMIQACTPNGMPNPNYMRWPITDAHYTDFQERAIIRDNTFRFEETLPNALRKIREGAYVRGEVIDGRVRLYVFSCGSFNNENYILAKKRYQYQQMSDVRPVLTKRIQPHEYYKTMQRVGEFMYDIYKDYLPPFLTPASIGRPVHPRNIDQFGQNNSVLQENRTIPIPQQDIVPPNVLNPPAIQLAFQIRKKHSTKRKRNPKLAKTRSKRKVRTTRKQT
jgi:hypothetical protein